MSITTPVNLAIIGAGMFARDAHVPALLAIGPQAFCIKAIYSRRASSAHELARLIPYPVDIETDLDELLARSDLDAVDIVVPVPDLPAVTERTLASGKHVISEKPIATDLATGMSLMAQQQPAQVWMVAENQRYHPLARQAADLIRNGEIGKPVLAHFVVHHPITPDSDLFQVEWRRSPSYPGGVLLSAGVHRIATLRMALGEIREVMAYTTGIGTMLPQDTLVANLCFESGLMGQLAITYATGPSLSLHFCVRGEGGEITLTQQGISIRHGDNELLQIPASGASGMKAQLRAFAAAIQQGEPHRNTAQEALQDLAVMEAIFQSAQLQRRVVVERVTRLESSFVAGQ